MAQDTTRGSRSLMEAVAEVAPDLDARRLAKDQPAGTVQVTPKGGPPPLPAGNSPPLPAAASAKSSASRPAPPPIPAATLAAMPKLPEMAKAAPPAAPKVAPSAASAPVQSAVTAAPVNSAPAAAPITAPAKATAITPATPATPVKPSTPKAATTPDAKPAPITHDAERDDKPSKRRPAGPARGAAIAANDDLPTIGGLVYALHQKPSRKMYVVAAGLSGLWFAVGAILAYLMIAPEWSKVAGAAELFGRPVVLISLATIVLPMVVFWAVAWLIYQAQDLRLRSSAMTEVAIRLAEPDREAEQAVTSLGQTVRRQVNYMNDAISQAIGRAGELEAMVHNEVAALEQSFTANEARMRGLLNEFAQQRNELTGTSDHVHQTLKAISQEVPLLLESLQGQQTKIAKLVEGAGHNLLALDNSLSKSSGQLETTLGERTTALQTLFVDRTTHLQTVLDEYTSALHTTLGTRTSEFQSVFEQFTTAIDTTLAARGESISVMFDESIRASSQIIDSTVGEKARLLAAAMDSHAKQLADTLGRQSQNLDETLLQGINAVRRTSENITRQSVKAIEGLAGQADMLKSVSENIFTQIGSVTSRFENQSQSILRAANSLESANHRIDQTLQNRHRELTDTLGRVSESTDQLGQQMTNYKSTIESSFNDAAQQTRALTDDLTRGAQSHAQSALSDLQRLRSDTEQQTTRAFDSLRDQFTSVSREISDQAGSLSSRFAETTDEIRARTRAASEDLAREQEYLRQQAQTLPDATRQSADAMRRVLSEQLKALDEVSRIATREQRQMDIAPPAPPPPRAALPHAQGVSLTAAVAEQNRAAAHPASGWSFGDLLARASRPEAASVVPEPAPQSPVSGTPINLDQIATALDVPTAGAIWARFRSGQRGILVRSIYSADGRAVFDDLSRRYQIDMPFRAMVDRFLADFEREVREVEARDRSGQMLQTHLVSSSGRVYLFLAHASGRLT